MMEHQRCHHFSFLILFYTIAMMRWSRVSLVLFTRNSRSTKNEMK